MSEKLEKYGVKIVNRPAIKPTKNSIYQVFMVCKL